MLLKRRDAASLERLMERYRPLLRELANQVSEPRLRSKLDRSDLVQETCLDAVRGFSNLRATDRKQFGLWLRTLLTNNLNSLRRRYLGAQKRNSAAEQSLSDMADRSRGGSPEYKHTLAAENLPVERAVLAERVERLHRILQNLPQPLQALLKWRFEEGLPFSQIAQRVDRSEDAVRMLVNRCLARLRPEIFNDESEL